MSGETPESSPENIEEMGLKLDDLKVEKPSREGEPVVGKGKGEETTRGELETVSVEKVGEEEADKVMSKVEIEADPFNSRQLTPGDLKEEGLAPRSKVSVGGKTFLFSPAYDLSRGHIGVVAYVEREEGFVARSYYRSSSHGLWRYLPDYIPVEDKIKFYGKGHSSESVTLPIVLQEALADVVENPENTI